MKLSELEAQIYDEFPDFKVVLKSESRFMAFLDFLLKLITFWQMRAFMLDVVTTVGNTVYVPTGWATRSDVSKMITLRHERVHMRQRAQYGSVMFTFLYLLFPFPIFFAYYRRKFEMEAYAESMRSVLELLPQTGRVILTSSVYREGILRHFTTSDYFWMWPFKASVAAWYDATLLKLLEQ